MGEPAGKAEVIRVKTWLHGSTSIRVAAETGAALAEAQAANEQRKGFLAALVAAQSPAVKAKLPAGLLELAENNPAA